MPLPTAARDYLLKALEGSPVVASTMVAGLGDGDPKWDGRLAPERFSLREVLAHLADWEPVWLDRLTKIAAGGEPFLPSVDESVLAVQNRYAESSPGESLRRFKDGRRELVAFLANLSDEAWDLKGDRQFVGILTLQQQAFFALTHDGYHLRQIAESVV